MHARNPTVIDWFLSVKNMLGALDQKARDAFTLHAAQGKEATAAINGYMKADYHQLWDRWRQRFPNEHLGALGRHIGKGYANISGRLPRHSESQGSQSYARPDAS